MRPRRKCWDFPRGILQFAKVQKATWFEGMNFFNSQTKEKGENHSWSHNQFLLSSTLINLRRVTILKLCQVWTFHKESRCQNWWEKSLEFHKNSALLVNFATKEVWFEWKKNQSEILAQTHSKIKSLEFRKKKERISLRFSFFSKLMSSDWKNRI